MTVFQALILGIVQGLAEFLPISSSAHLVLIPWLFHWQDPGLTFDVALHMGTLLAVVLYFWKDWVNLIAAALRPSGKRARYVAIPSSNRFCCSAENGAAIVDTPLPAGAGKKAHKIPFDPSVVKRNVDR